MKSSKLTPDYPGVFPLCCKFICPLLEPWIIPALNYPHVYSLCVQTKGTLLKQMSASAFDVINLSQCHIIF